MASFPASQHAIQLVGPGKLQLNTGKPVTPPGPRQLLARIEAVGLCFSDMKLLKQFADHPRKCGIESGIDPGILRALPSYVPGDRPTVPGHEVCCRIVAVGEGVTRHRVGERVMVQADLRELRTKITNGAFGYNFEGGLQEYVLLDERVMIEPSTGERYLLPVPDSLSASAIALVEPWACVENSYANPERRTLKGGGKLLVVADAGHAIRGLDGLLAPPNRPGSITVCLAEKAQRDALRLPAAEAADPAALPNESFDDIVYFGAKKAVLDVLNDKLAVGGLINVVTAGRRIGAPVTVGVGRVHYALTRWIGTASDDASASLRSIPATGELRPGDRVRVVGAGGPMGQMHVIRSVCSGIAGLTVTGTDVDDARLETLARKASPLARERGVNLELVNTQKSPAKDKATYFALMAPVAVLVADALRESLNGTLINIFAGIPAPVKHDLDLDAYIERQCYMFGTSGSLIRDMKAVLAKVERGRLDTNLSVDAVAGMAGAVDGLAAVENRKMLGKIVIYPELHDVPLIPLSEMAKHFPTVAANLAGGSWTASAEEELLKAAARR
jgi:threonine dehydrogenase-like Zn-dependent dehydrogenase